MKNDYFSDIIVGKNSKIKVKQIPYLSLGKGDTQIMKKRMRIGTLFMTGIFFCQSILPMNGFIECNAVEYGSNKKIGTIEVEQSDSKKKQIQKQSNLEENKKASFSEVSENAESIIGSLMVLDSNKVPVMVNQTEVYGKESQFQFTLGQGYDIENVNVEIKAGKKSYNITPSQIIQNEMKEESNTYQFTLPKDMNAVGEDLNFHISVHKKRIVNPDEEQLTGEAIDVSLEEWKIEKREFQNIHVEFTRPKLKITTEYTSGKWTDQNVSFVLENEEKDAKAEAAFYVKEPSSEQWVELQKDKWETDEQGRLIYVVSKTVDGTYQFKAQYNLNTGKDLLDYISDTARKVVRIDKQVPKINVSKTKLGKGKGDWTQGSYKFVIKNSKNNISPITYYVRKNNSSSWQVIPAGTNKTSVEYIIDGECNKDQYQFKIVSAVGEEAQIYNNESKSWVSDTYNVFIDKTAPKKSTIHIKRDDIDFSTSKWYGEKPEISISTEQDAGSKITTYYYLYLQGEDKGEKKTYGKDPIKLGKDGVYVLEVFSEDEAYNQSKTVSETIKLSTKQPSAPTITFTSKDGKPITFTEFKKYQLFSNELVLVTIEADDSLSGIASITYKSTGSNLLKETTVNKKNISFYIPPAFMGNIQAFATNMAGNISDTAESKNLVVEKKKPSISIFSDADNHEWHNSNIEFQVSIADTQAGIAQVEYQLNGKVIKSSDYKTKKQYVTTEDRIIKATEEAEDKNGYELKVVVTDNAGNQTSAVRKIYIDKTAPVVQLSGVTNKSVSSQDKTLVVQVQEKVYQYNKVKVNVTRMVDGKEVPYTNPSFASNQVLSTKKISFTQDGTYIVTVEAEDKAGNTAKEQRMEFTIDKTKPVILLAGANQEEFHNKAVDLNIGVIESNYKNNQVSIYVTKKLENKVKRYVLSSWNNTGRMSNLITTFAEDGTYTIKVVAQDEAGNQAEEKTIQFVVDRTAPKITIPNLSPYHLSDAAVQFALNVKELNYKKGGIRVDVIQEDKKGKKTNINIGNIDSLQKDTTFSYVFSEEGKYFINVKAEDHAGNTTVKQQVFTIDNKPPIIRNVKKYNKKYLKSFSLPASFYEWIEDITPVSYKVYLNGVEYDGLTEITENGKYVLKVEATDKMNQQSSETVEFMIDSQAPEIMFSTMVNGEKVTLAENAVINEQSAITVSLEDGEDYIDTVLVNGKEEQIKKKQKEVEVFIDTLGEHTIEVTAKDLAGNQCDKILVLKYADAKEVEATANTNPVQEVVAESKAQNDNYNLLYVCGIAIFIIMLGIIYVIVTEKRKRKV